MSDGYLAERYATKLARMTALVEKIVVSEHAVSEELVEAWMEFLLVHVEQIKLMQEFVVRVEEIRQSAEDILLENLSLEPPAE